MGLFSSAKKAVSKITGGNSIGFNPAALIGSGGSSALISGGLGMAANYLGARAQNEANSAQTQAQMDFQERMSSTAHQREVADLRAAGLNPILSATGGAGASTPSGASASMVNEADAGINTALQALKTVTDSYLVREQTELAKAKTATEGFMPEQISTQTKNIEQQTATSKATEKLLGAQRTNTLQDTINKGTLNLLLKNQNLTETQRRALMTADTSTALQRLKTYTMEGKVSETTYGLIMEYAKRANNIPLDSIPTLLNSAKAIKHFNKTPTTTIFKSR